MITNQFGDIVSPYDLGARNRLNKKNSKEQFKIVNTQQRVVRQGEGNIEFPEKITKGEVITLLFEEDKIAFRISNKAMTKEEVLAFAKDKKGVWKTHKGIKE